MVLFQPHRYTRTQALWDEFCRAFHQADVLLLTDIYAAGEEPIAGVTRRGAGARDRASGATATSAYAGDLKAATERLVAEAREGDVVLTLGAGSVWTAGEELLRRLRLTLMAESCDGRASDGGAAGGRCAVPRERAVLAAHLHGRRRAGGRDGLPALARGAAPDARRAQASWTAPHRVLGGGSNLVVVDEGLDELVINTQDLSPRARGRRRRRDGRGRRQPDPHRGALLPRGLARDARAPSGIPGSVGGAAVMNAGAYGFSISDVLKEIVVYDEDGERDAAARGLALPLPRLVDPRGLRGRQRQRRARARRSRGARQGDPRAAAPARARASRRGATRAASSRTRPGATRARSSTSWASRARGAAAPSVSEKHANFVVNERAPRRATCSRSWTWCASASRARRASSWSWK